MLASGVEYDRGLPPGYLAENPEEYLNIIRDVANSPLANRVEVRRWWTLHDANSWLDSSWHVMLLGLYMLETVAGEHAFGKVRLTVPKDL